MSRYTIIRAKMDKYSQAAAVLPQLQSLYRQAVAITDIVELYQSGTDPAFNEAVENIFSVAERAKLGQMVNGLKTLIAAWEANHAAILNENINAP